MFVNDVTNDRPQTMQFDTTGQKQHKNWKKVIDDLHEGTVTFDDLTNEEKEYIKTHDPLYAQYFII